MWRKLLFLLALSFFWAPPTLAFTISPVRFLITADPGSTQVTKIQVDNDEAIGMKFVPVVFGVRQGEKGQPVFGKNLESAEQWVKSVDTEINVGPGGKSEVVFEIDIPRDAIPGSHYLGLGVESGNTGKSNVGFSPRLLSLITIQVSGSAYESLLVKKFESEQSWTSQKSWRFDLVLENKGNVEVPVSGELVINSWRGHALVVKQIFSNNKVLAGAQKITNFETDVAGSVLWPGIYQVESRIAYGLTKQSITAVDYVWYWPVWSLVGLSVVVIVVFMLTFKFVRKIKMKKLQARYDKT